MELKQNKDTKELIKEISEILVINDNDLSPYIEVINFSQENIIQKPLGTLVGCLEIKDDYNSAYTVNKLSAAIKKEYFLNPKRTPEKSFEAALNKGNLFLSELANQDNISWMGKLDVALCAIEGQNIHFSVTGAAKILLIRAGQMLDISAGLISEESLDNPLKTFTDISSGQLQGGDRVIITTDDIFHILSPEIILQKSQEFPDAKFSRFIKTALVNELAIAGTIVVDIHEQIVHRRNPVRDAYRGQSQEQINFFSGNVFGATNPHQAAYDIQEYQEHQAFQDYQENAPDELDEYVDIDSNHIYIKDSEPVSRQNIDQFEQLSTRLKEILFDVTYWYKNNVHRKILIKATLNKEKLRDIQQVASAISSKIPEKISIINSNLINTAKEKIIPLPSKEKPPLEEEEHFEEQFEPEQSLYSQKTESDYLEDNFERESELEDEFEQEKTTATKKIDFRQKLEPLKKLIPNFRKIRIIFIRMSQKQKIYAFLIIAFIILFPLISSKVKGNRKETVDLTANSIQNVQLEPTLENETNIRFIDETTKIATVTGIIAVRHTNNETFALTSTAINVIKENGVIGEYPYPAEFGKVKLSTFMDDLALFYILSDTNQLFAFNAITKKFQHSQIAIPDDSKVTQIGAFMTYLYLVDERNNQLYRYPKTEGGFGEKSLWLKDATPLKDITSINIDGTVTLTQNHKTPLILFNKQKDNVTFEDSQTPIEFYDLNVNSAKEEFYALDKKNSRVIFFSQNGKIKAQYYNDIIKEAIDFSISDTNEIYIATKDGVYKISTQQQ